MIKTEMNLKADLQKEKSDSEKKASDTAKVLKYPHLLGFYLLF